MPNDPFDDPALNAQIGVKIRKITSEWMESVADTPGEIKSSKIIDVLIRQFDAYAEGYLEAVQSESQVVEYETRIAVKAAAIVEKVKSDQAAERADLANSIRQLAATSVTGEKARELSKDQAEALIHSNERDLTDIFSKRITKKTAREADMLVRLATLLTARCVYWNAGVTQRVSGLPNAVERAPLPEVDRRLQLTTEQSKVLGRNIMDYFLPRCKWRIRDLVEAAKPHLGSSASTIHHWKAGTHAARILNVEPLATAIGTKLRCELTIQDLLANDPSNLPKLRAEIE